MAFFPEREQPDARKAVFVSFQVAKPPDTPVDKESELFYGRGVVGVRAVLLDEERAPITDEWGAEAYYVGDSQPGAERGRRFIGANATGYFYNVPPGRYPLRLLPPDGATLFCSVDPLRSAWPTADPNTYRVYAEAGRNAAVARVFCELH